MVCWPSGFSPISVYNKLFVYMQSMTIYIPSTTTVNMIFNDPFLEAVKYNYLIRARIRCLLFRLLISQFYACGIGLYMVCWVLLSVGHCP